MPVAKANFLTIAADEEVNQRRVTNCSQGLLGYVFCCRRQAMVIRRASETSITPMGHPGVVRVATNIEYDKHKGRVAVGRLHAGILTKGMDVRVCTSEDACRFGKVSELFVYDQFNRVPAERVEAGDICAVCGINDIQIGETIADKITGKPLPSIKVEEPTVRMSFSINTSSFVGREGKYVTTRNLRDRLYRELERNLAMKVEDGENSDTFIVSGRGTLHITILMGYNFIAPEHIAIGLFTVDDGSADRVFKSLKTSRRASERGKRTSLRSIQKVAGEYPP